METKKDCFAYTVKNGKEECTGLDGMYCQIENCRFYKTRQQLGMEIRKYLVNLEEK